MSRLTETLLRTLWIALWSSAPLGALAEDGPIQPAALYQRNCAACHGEKGDAQSRARASLSQQPRDFTSDQARRELPRAFMIAIVRDGKHEKPMVGRKSRLSQEQIEAVVDFIRAAFMPPETGTPMAQGRVLYLKTCASCHGDRGRNAAFPSLSRSRAGPELTREAMVAAITREKHGTAPAGFSKQLSSAEIQGVVDYIRTAFIDSVPAARASEAEAAR